MARLWVARLTISDSVAQKIIHKHRVLPHEVREAVVCVDGLPARRDTHPQRGLRWLVEVAIGGHRYQVVLYPSPFETDVFALGSCYRL